ncbi:MAG: hypothetical protein ACT4QC_17835 [Planctomycetaceae bacterium]
MQSTGFVDLVKRERALYLLFMMATGLALCGCGSQGEVQGVIQSRTSARDALKTQGAKFTEKNLPLIGQTFAVDLSGLTGVTDETFVLLKQTGMPVIDLNLSHTSVRDEQLAQLAPGLTRLNLSDTEISDKGLEHLTHMGLLGELDLTNTKVTAEGVNTFLKARADIPEVQAKRPKIKR